MSISRFLVAISVSASLAACASPTPLGGAPDVTVAQSSALPMPTQADFAPSSLTGLIRPLDVLQIELFGVEELSREVQVSANGNIDYPLIGSVEAVGRTTEELSYLLEDRFRQTYVRNPDVTSRITARVEQQFTIGGEVDRPGRYALQEPVTLMQAVAIGGGLEEYANRQEVLIFREIGDQRYIGVYNLQGIQRGNYADPIVYPDDIVMVGDSSSRRRLDQILEIGSSILTPLVLVERIIR